MGRGRGRKNNNFNLEHLSTQGKLKKKKKVASSGTGWCYTLQLPKGDKQAVSIHPPSLCLLTIFFPLFLCVLFFVRSPESYLFPFVPSFAVIMGFISCLLNWCLADLGFSILHRQ